MTSSTPWRAIVLMFPLLSIHALAYDCSAYSELTHKRIVQDAFEYVIATSGEDIRYPDNTNSRSDYMSLRDILAPGVSWPSEIDRRLRDAGSLLGDASAQTDRFQDVWFKLGNSAAASAPLVGSFTVLSHFINVRTPGVLWDNDGYYYGWVSQNQKCSDPSGEDRFANFVIANIKAVVDISKSDAVVRYRDPLRIGVTTKDYTERLEQEIAHIRFWPISHLARYWFDAFLKTGKSRDGRPADLPWLGPVLHAVADATVPFHAAGLSGCGHGAYEDVVETLYQRGQIYAKDEVKRLLLSSPHLRRGTSPIDLVTENAKTASDPRFCKCTLGSCDCAVVRDEKAAKELVNLAIASSVVVLRKALLSWRAHAPKARAEGSAEATRLVGAVEPSRTFSTFEAVSIASPKIIGFDLRQAALFEAELMKGLRGLKDTVVDFERRKLVS